MIAGTSILLIDDARPMRLLVRCALRSFGVSDIVEANDGGEALRAMAVRRFDLILTDVRMEPMDGITFTRHLRTPGTAAPATPILILSGHNDAAHVKAALEAGASDFLVKPLVPSELKVRVENVLRNKKAIVRTEDYHGPDRRRRALWVRHDRRQGEARQVCGL